MGPFLTNYRNEMVQEIWIKQINELNIPCTPKFSFSEFLSKPTVRIRNFFYNILKTEIPGTLVE